MISLPWSLGLENSPRSCFPQINPFFYLFCSAWFSLPCWQRNLCLRWKTHSWVLSLTEQLLKNYSPEWGGGMNFCISNMKSLGTMGFGSRDTCFFSVFLHIITSSVTLDDSRHEEPQGGCSNVAHSVFLEFLKAISFTRSYLRSYGIEKNKDLKY